MVGERGSGRGIELNAENLARLDGRLVVPGYDRSALARGIVHIGVGGFHRAHQAVYLDQLCAAGLTDWSITGAGVMASDAAMAEALDAQDRLYTLIIRDARSTEVRVIGSIVDYVLATLDLEPLVARLADPSTRIVSLTITEGGYPVDEATGAFMLPPGTELPPTFEAIARALRIRRSQGRGGFTVMSCDNIMHNGVTARAATVGVAGLLEPGLDGWVSRNVSFPNAMVDRITPVTADADRDFLADEYGLVDRWPVVAEPFIQWVIEDTFADGRPPWQDAGVLFTSDVQPYETLKLRLLNAGHTCLAYLAALAGHVYVHELMADARFSLFLERFLDEEASPSLPAVPGIDVERYKEQLTERFGNPEIGDQVARLCLDGSSKFPKFLVPTIEAQLDDADQVKLAALALAGWCQYLLGIDDDGRGIEVAHDPNLDGATGFAQASRSDPLAFLGFSEVFVPRLADDPVFQEAFTAALESIRENGVAATLDRWLDRES
ncbi:MAG: mannitol dehydrogenase family protein [Chloroflexota bacterium]